MAEQQTMVQVELESGTSRLTTWVEKRSDMGVGSRITLKDSEHPDRLWTVLSVSKEHPRSDIKRGWSNNI